MEKLGGWLFLVCVFSANLFADEGARIEQAEALLAKGKKKEALKILEKSFDRSQDPQEVHKIGNLILNAAPYDYPKRENFLRYLVKFVPDDPDTRLWLMELGDRARRRKGLDEAEDWYLRAEAIQGDQAVLDQKFFDLYLEQKLLHKAFERGVHILEMHPEKNTPAFRKKLAEIWWKTGPINEELFARLTSLPNGLEIVHDLITQTPKKGPAKDKVYSQLRDHEQTKKLVPKEDKKEAASKHTPLVAESPASKEVIKTDMTPKETFESKEEKPTAPKLEMSAAPAVNDEAPPKKDQQPDKEAAKVDRAKSEKTPTIDMTPKEAPLVEAEEVAAPEITKELKTKKDYIERAVVLSKESNPSLKAINDLVVQIYAKFPLTAEEEATRESMGKLEKWKQNQFPKKFDTELLSQVRACQEDIDLSLNKINSGSRDWKIITRPFVEMIVNTTAKKMLSALDQADIPSDADEADKKTQKMELIREIEKKYSEYLP